MSFCQDRDLLCIEPIVYLSGGAGGQSLAAGADGAIAGTTFTSAGSDFVSAGVQAGMVLCTYDTIPAEGRAWEILAVDSATTLSISVLRAEVDGPAVAPPAGTGLSFHVRSFGPQMRGVSATLAEKLRQIAEVAGVASADFADSAQLRATTAHGALAGIFLARADNARPHDANWIKAEFHRAEFLRLQDQLRLAVDLDGDGVAEQTRTLGNVYLKRV
ncbi:MAG: hypothetical protein JW849_00805 [Phycisphaerae bacterium]|nr:hypothetical protein [Phycisphaerae bacterium]